MFLFVDRQHLHVPTGFLYLPFAPDKLWVLDQVYYVNSVYTVCFEYLEVHL